MSYEDFTKEDIAKPDPRLSGPCIAKNEYAGEEYEEHDWRLCYEDPGCIDRSAGNIYFCLRCSLCKKKTIGNTTYWEYTRK